MQKYTASVITAGCLWGLMGLFTRTLATYGVDSTADQRGRAGAVGALHVQDRTFNMQRLADVGVTLCI